MHDHSTTREVHLSTEATVLSLACLGTNTKNECVLELVVALDIWFLRGKWHSCHLANLPVLSKIYPVNSQPNSI